MLLTDIIRRPAVKAGKRFSADDSFLGEDGCRGGDSVILRLIEQGFAFRDIQRSVSRKDVTRRASALAAGKNAIFIEVRIKGPVELENFFGKEKHVVVKIGGARWLVKGFHVGHDIVSKPVLKIALETFCPQLPGLHLPAIYKIALGNCRFWPRECFQEPLKIGNIMARI